MRSRPRSTRGPASPLLVGGEPAGAPWEDWSACTRHGQGSVDQRRGQGDLRHTSAGGASAMSMSPITPAGDAVRIADWKALPRISAGCTYTSPVVQGRIVTSWTAAAAPLSYPKKPANQIKAKELVVRDLSGEFFASPGHSRWPIYAVNRSAEFFILDAVTGKTRLKKTLELAAGRWKRNPTLSQHFAWPENTCSSATMRVNPF